MIQSSSEGLHAFDRIQRSACALCLPPEKLTVAEWADRYGMLSPEGSANPGKWFTSNAEYQREPMEQLTNPDFQTIVLMWASQVGKTQIGLWFNAYIIDQDPGPTLFIEPTEDMAKVISQDRLAPMIRDTPRLRKIFAGKDAGNDTLHKVFPGGHLTLAGAESPAQLAGRPIRYLITDEEGRYKRSAGKEGDPVAQAKKRIATFKSRRKHLRISSPNLRKTCSITDAYEHSDQRLYFVPCPQCGEFQTLRWTQLKWPRPENGAAKHLPDQCYYVCEHNGCEIREDDKFSMVARGQWRATAPGNGDGKTAGYKLSALYSVIGYTWPELINDYLESIGTATKEQTFTNTVLAEPWDEQAEGADFGVIQKRARPYPAQAPAWCVIVTCGADVQKDRIEATKWGWGIDNVSGVIEHRVFRGDPTGPEVWKDFEAWRSQMVEHESCIQLPVACTFIDSGDGNRTQSVYEFTRKREKLRIFACKGSSLAGAPLVNRGNRVGKYKTVLVSVGASTAKDIIFSRLQIEAPALPGYINFPSAPESGCDADYFTQLTNEHLVTRESKAGPYTSWEAKGRNEALDCAVYALAAKEFTRANLKLLAAKLQRKAASLPKRLQKPDVNAPVEVWAKQVADNAIALQTPLTPRKAPTLHKSRPKRIVRPGSRWING